MRGEGEERGGLFHVVFSHLSVIFVFIPPSFLFALLLKRYLYENQLLELPPGVFDNLGSLTKLYVGRKKEKKKREEGCFMLYFPPFVHLSNPNPPRFFLFFP